MSFSNPAAGVASKLLFASHVADGLPLDLRIQTGRMTLCERVAHYHRMTGFPESLFVGGDGRIVGTWIMGNDYRVKSEYYGGYPAGYLRRVKAMFPDKNRVLHIFSGKVDTLTMPGHTVDSNPNMAPDFLDDAHTMESVPLESYDLVMADPPYSVEDCEHYGTTMVKRNKVLAALGARLTPGCHVVWLDQVLPMYKKTCFKMVGVIGMVKSTNHRFRVVTIFEKHESQENLSSVPICFPSKQQPCDLLLDKVSRKTAVAASEGYAAMENKGSEILP